MESHILDTVFSQSFFSLEHFSFFMAMDGKFRLIILVIDYSYRLTLNRLTWKKFADFHNSYSIQLSRQLIRSIWFIWIKFYHYHYFFIYYKSTLMIIKMIWRFFCELLINQVKFKHAARTDIFDLNTLRNTRKTEKKRYTVKKYYKKDGNFLQTVKWCISWMENFWKSFAFGEYLKHLIYLQYTVCIEWI